MFAREVKELYLHAKASLESPNADSEDLDTIKIKMEAAVQHLRRLGWALDLTRPCGGDIYIYRFAELDYLVEDIYCNKCIYIYIYICIYHA